MGRRGDSDDASAAADARHLKKLVAAVAAVAFALFDAAAAAVAFALIDAAAADAPAKVFGALPVNCLLDPEVHIAAHNNAVFRGGFGHRRVSAAARGMA